MSQKTFSSCKYIAAGYLADSEKLLQAFVLKNSFEFPVFAQIWKKHHFYAIFLGRDRHEVEPFTNEIFQITLGYLKNSTFLYQVGAIYLLYALFRNQITGSPVMIRITLPQFEIFRKVQTASMVGQLATLQYVTDYLCQNAFDFVAQTSLLGPRATKTKIDYDKTAYSGLFKEIKSEITHFHDSKVLENLIDLNKKYADLKKKVYSQKEVSNTIYQYEKYKEQLDSLVNEGSTGYIRVKSHPKKESSIGTRRTRIKDASFSNKARFRQLNPSDDEDYESENQTSPSVGRRKYRRKRIRNEVRKIGRPRKLNLETLLEDSDKMSETSASDMDSTEIKQKKERCPLKRGPRKVSFLDGYKYNRIPESSPMKLLLGKKRLSSASASSSSESEEIISEESASKSSDVKEILK